MLTLFYLLYSIPMNIKKAFQATVVLSLLFALIPTSHAESQLAVQLKAFNITQNQDATTVTNRPGDVLRYTADVRNQGPDDLVDYEMRVYIKDILQYGSIVDLGGGVIEGDYIKYPPILQAVSCNCSNANYFKVKLKENVCEVTALSATYEDVTTTVPVGCDIPPPPPVVPTRTGPGALMLFILAIFGSVLTVRLAKQRV